MGSEMCIRDRITEDDWVVFEGEIDVPDNAGPVRLAVTRRADDDAQYAVQVTPTTDADEDRVEPVPSDGRSRSPKKSGCASAPGDHVSGWWLLLGVGVLRRRRASQAEFPRR